MIKKLIKSILSMILIILSFVLYVTYIERSLLIVRTDSLTLNESGNEKIKVIHFTDTQLGEFYTLDQLDKVVRKINKLDADIVVFTGDLIDNASQYEDLYKVSDVLGKINAKLGKYAVYGNHDYGGGAVRYYKDIMNKAGFSVLRNGKEQIKVNGRVINIFGGDDALLGNHDAKKTMNGINEEDVNILLIHEPDLIDKYTEYPIDLALSGHSHGGQVYIPFYGAIKKNVLAEKYNKGLYEIDNNRGTKLYVSSGLGNTKVPFRFLNIPEIKVFEISI